jgi:hypothetical protein
MMPNFIDQSIGGTTRDQHSYDRPTPTPQGSNQGVHVGIVCDDIDEMKMQRCWVYIPGVSAYNPNIAYDRVTPTRDPPGADGTPGAQNPEKRVGFMLAHPITPFHGSDKTREPSSSDGRNSQIGQSNSYGFSAQPRNGDMVLVAFANGDPSQCYYIGHVPKTGENDMVPGLKPAKTTASGSGVSTPVGPAIQQTTTETAPKAQTVFFNNLTDSGLIQDPLRGSGSSSSTRESPSRVTGMKTAGDPDTNMMGHQFVLDDHPDSQLIRLRTSKGAQLLLSDTGDFIYVSSGTGKSWLEMDDSGNVHVYAHSSINYHTEQDFNMTCDRDFNLHVGGNSNWVTKGDTRMRMAGGANITVGESGGDLDITTINNFHVKTQGEIRIGAKVGITTKSADFLEIQSTNDMKFKTGQALTMQSHWDTNLKPAGKLSVLAVGSAQISATRVDLAAPTIQFTSPTIKSSTAITVGGTSPTLAITDVPDGNDPNQADLPIQHSVMTGPQTSGPPTAPTGTMQSTTPIVPQHEPWGGHVGQHPGHNAAMPSSSLPKLKSA